MPPIQTVLSTLARLLPSIPNTTTVRLSGQWLNRADVSPVCAAFAAEGCLPRLVVLLADHQMSPGLGSILKTHPSMLVLQILKTVSLARQATMLRPGLMACYQCSKTESAKRDGKDIPSLIVDAADDPRVVHHLLDGSIRLPIPPSLVCLNFNKWDISYSPIVQSMSAARALHIAAVAPPSSRAVDATAAILDAIASLTSLEELIWTSGATVPAQQELFARDARGEMPHSLRTIKFVWLDYCNTLCFSGYVRKDMSTRRWSEEPQEAFEVPSTDPSRLFSTFLSSPSTLHRVQRWST